MYTSSLKCDFCEDTFTTKTAYSEHANFEHPEEIRAAKWHKCKFCETFLPSTFDMGAHRRKSCSNASQKSAKADGPTPDPPVPAVPAVPGKSFPCQYCGRHFSKSLVAVLRTSISADKFSDNF
jgi:hypothetical protein